MRSLLFLLFTLAPTFVVAQELSIEKLGLKPPSTSNCTPVKDQYRSSTCWSFSSTSLLESELLKKGKGKVDLSEMFIARFSMLRKIERHLKLKGGNFFTPGGQFHDVIWVMKNYGIVPEDVYTGKPYGENNHDHAALDTLLSHFVKEQVSRGVTILGKQQRSFIDSVLDYYMGELPETFIYKSKSYTAKSFLQQALQLNPDDYVEITSYTHHPFYSQFILEDKYNWTGDEYWNVPLADFARITDLALDNGYTVGWDGDATDTGFKFYDGLAYIPNPIKNSISTQRQMDFENQTTWLDHMMHIVGRTKELGDQWYYVKNSWGDYSNVLGGFLYMREDYFKLRTVAIIVNKAAIPLDIRKKLGI